MMWSSGVLMLLLLAICSGGSYVSSSFQSPEEFGAGSDLLIAADADVRVKILSNLAQAAITGDTDEDDDQEQQQQQVRAPEIDHATGAVKVDDKASPLMTVSDQLMHMMIQKQILQQQQSSQVPTWLFCFFFFQVFETNSITLHSILQEPLVDKHDFPPFQIIFLFFMFFVVSSAFSTCSYRR